MPVLIHISLIFGKVGLYVTENGTALVLFNRVDLSRLSTFLTWFQMMFSLYHESDLFVLIKS